MVVPFWLQKRIVVKMRLQDVILKYFAVKNWHFEGFSIFFFCIFVRDNVTKPSQPKGLKIQCSSSSANRVQSKDLICARVVDVQKPPEALRSKMEPLYSKCKVAKNLTRTCQKLSKTLTPAANWLEPKGGGGTPPMGASIKLIS